MLQNIRERAQGWIAWTIVVILGLTFVLWGVERYENPGDSAATQTVATVNGVKISQNLFTTILQRYQEQQSQQNIPVNLAATKEIVLNQLIRSIALEQAAHKQGFRVTNQQIQEVLANIPAFQINGSFSKERFDEVLSRMMYSEDDFINQLRQDLILSQQQMGIVSSAFVLPSEIDSAYVLLAQQRDFSSLVVPFQNFIKNATVSPQEIQAYYKANPQQFQAPESVSIQYLQLSLPDLQKTLQVSDKDVQQYYQENIDNFTKPQEWQIAHIFLKFNLQDANSQKDLQQKANEIIEKLKTGGDFANLAQQYSDDVLSSKKGGTLPWFSAGMMDKSVESAIKNLQQNQIAGPIETSSGIEIIKLLGIKPAQAVPFSQVQDQVKNQLLSEKVQKIFADSSDQLANLTYANPNSLQIAANSLHLPILSSGMFTRSGGPAGSITANPKVISASFSTDVLGGNNSDIIPLDAQNVIVLRMLKHEPATEKSLSQVQGDITALLQKQKAEHQANQLAGTIAQKIQQGADPRTLANQYNLPLENYANTGRKQQGIDAEILQRVFDLPKPSSSQKLVVQAIPLVNGNSIVLVLSKVTDGNPSALKPADQAKVSQALLNNLSQEEYEAYVKSIVAAAKIKIDAKNTPTA